MSRELLQRLVLYKRSMGQSDAEIVSGMFHTITETLGMSSSDAQIAIRDAEFSKLASDLVFSKSPVANHNTTREDGKRRRGISALFNQDIPR